jgi:hypothetical protein
VKPLLKSIDSALTFFWNSVRLVFIVCIWISVCLGLMVRLSRYVGLPITYHWLAALEKSPVIWVVVALLWLGCELILVSTQRDALNTGTGQSAQNIFYSALRRIFQYPYRSVAASLFTIILLAALFHRLLSEIEALCLAGLIASAGYALYVTRKLKSKL